jgi:hypothetical protein
VWIFLRCSTCVYFWGVHILALKSTGVGAGDLAQWINFRLLCVMTSSTVYFWPKLMKKVFTDDFSRQWVAKFFIQRATSVILKDACDSGDSRTHPHCGEGLRPWLLDDFVEERGNNTEGARVTP